MKRLLIPALAALLLLTGCAHAPSPQQAADAEEKEEPSWVQIDQETAKRMMEADDGHVIVDVRRQDEYDAGHIPGAILIPNESIVDERPSDGLCEHLRIRRDHDLDRRDRQAGGLTPSNL